MLLDYNMPSMTGHELLLAIKYRYPEFSQPIFAMTASLNFEGSEQIKTAFDGMLTKPFDVEALVNALSAPTRHHRIRALIKKSLRSSRMS